MNKQKELEQLIYMISRLPGLGRRSATWGVYTCYQIRKSDLIA